jgi:hypothetical protein
VQEHGRTAQCLTNRADRFELRESPIAAPDRPDARCDMSDSQADEFRKQAEECRQLEATALKAIDKASGCAWPRTGSNSRRRRTGRASGDRRARGPSLQGEGNGK